MCFKILCHTAVHTTSVFGFVQFDGDKATFSGKSPESRFRTEKTHEQTAIRRNIRPAVCFHILLFDILSLSDKLKRKIVVRIEHSESEVTRSEHYLFFINLNLEAHTVKHISLREGEIV